VNFFVTKDFTNGKLAGCVAALPSTELNGDEYLELVHMSIGRAYRSTSIGPLLVKAVEDWARSLGYKKVTLTTWNVNIPACRCYAKLGYRVLEGQQPKGYRLEKKGGGTGLLCERLEMRNSVLDTIAKIISPLVHYIYFVVAAWSFVPFFLSLCLL
jgi:hypothetical protein